MYPAGELRCPTTALVLYGCPKWFFDTEGKKKKIENNRHFDTTQNVEILYILHLPQCKM